jgi:hypothetical protein
MGLAPFLSLSRGSHATNSVTVEAAQQEVGTYIGREILLPRKLMRI